MSKNRLLELDVFRGFAAIAVVLFHYTTLFHEKVGHPQEILFEFSHGHFGVELFFIISGFVISLTLNRTNTMMDFVVSRFSRLYPVYWFSVLLTFSVISIWEIPGQNHSLSKALINLLMFHGFFGYPHIDGVYWSLQYELMFYVYMLLAFSFGMLGRIKSICYIWLLLQFVCWFSNWYFEYFPWKIQYFLILDYGNLFIAGIMFYFLHSREKDKEYHAIIILCLAIQLLRDGFLSAGVVTFFFSLFYLFVTGKLQWIVVRPLVYLGSISYSLYLTHQNIGYSLFIQMHNLGISANLSIILMLILALVIAHALTFYIERPAMKSIRSFYASRKK